MTKMNTVLVLGAGASAPYGFPYGQAMIDKVLQVTGNPSGYSSHEAIETTWRDLGIDIDARQKFIDRLSDTDLGSIDQFLTGIRSNAPASEVESLRRIGKAAIAMSLMACEAAKMLRERSDERWYPYLRQQLGTGPRDLTQSNVKIITFNYDRSLDQYLFDKMAAISDMEQAAQALQEFDIVHVHGQIGKLPFQNKTNMRPYSTDISLEFVSSAMDEIWVMDEVDNESEKYSEAKNYLRAAERVIFLGFGYHPDNLNRLDVDAILKGKEIWGTTSGMNPRETEALDARLATLDARGQKSLFNEQLLAQYIHAFLKNYDLLS